MLFRSTKLFVVGAESADFGLVFANAEEEDGSALGVSLFVVESEREGFQRWRPYRTMSPARDVMELNLSNLRIPATNRLGEVGQAAGFGEEFLVRRRVFAAAELTGVASAAQDMARGQIHARREFGSALSAQQGARWALADNEINIQLISSSEVRIACIIQENQLDSAIRALHEAFDLSNLERKQIPTT